MKMCIRDSRDGNGRGHGEAGAEADIDGDRAEDDAEEGAEQNGAQRELRAIIAGGNKRLKLGHDKPPRVRKPSHGNSLSGEVYHRRACQRQGGPSRSQRRRINLPPMRPATPDSPAPAGSFQR